MMKLFLILLFIFFLSPSTVYADDNNQFINIVNPVRISSYNPEPGKSLESQYSFVHENNLPATWLLTYDAITNQEIYFKVRKMDNKQELGIFLEVTRNLAKEAGVSYHETGSWHHASSIFLSGYAQEERIKLIDSVFNKFKEKFGYYPKSVGSWWTDSFSLSYIAEKYGVKANLTVSDQFETDGYQVWGQYWSASFYPSKYHSAIPASEISNKLDVVVTQWAAREPTNGYKSSLFSTQDYKQVGLDIDFFKSLIQLYGRTHDNLFGQITVGLEADLGASGYKGEFRKQMEYIKELVQSNEFEAVTMSGFSDWYRQKFPGVSPQYKVETDNTIWYQSPIYRIGIYFDKEKSTIFDLRIYSENYQEPYYISPNREKNLYINLPAIIDSMSSPEESWEIVAGRWDFEFQEDGFTIKKKVDFPIEIIQSKFLEISHKGNKTSIKIKNSSLGLRGGLIISGWSVEAKHFFSSKRFIIDLLRGIGWKHFYKVKYLLPDDEMFALYKLSLLPQGRVLVYDKECLQCKYNTHYKPPAFSNNRDYVSKFADKPIVQNQKVFEAKTQKEAKDEFQKTKARYIYLVKSEDYIEKIPFSPGDLGVKKIFENANAQIWEVD